MRILMRGAAYCLVVLATIVLFGACEAGPGAKPAKPEAEQPTMATQTVPSTILSRVMIGEFDSVSLWFIGATNPELLSQFAPPGRYLQAAIAVRQGQPGSYSYAVHLHVDDNPNESSTMAGDDFDEAFEAAGSVEVTVAGNSYIFDDFTATDPDEPYSFTEGAEDWWTAPSRVRSQ